MKGPQTKWQHLQTCQHKRVDTVVLPSTLDHKIHKDKAVFPLAAHRAVRPKTDGRTCAGVPNPPDITHHPSPQRSHVCFWVLWSRVRLGSEPLRSPAVLGSLWPGSSSRGAPLRSRCWGWSRHAGGSGSASAGVELDGSGAPAEAPRRTPRVHAGTVQPLQQRPQRRAVGQHRQELQERRWGGSVCLAFGGYYRFFSQLLAHTIFPCHTVSESCHSNSRKHTKSTKPDTNYKFSIS